MTRVVVVTTLSTTIYSGLLSHKVMALHIYCVAYCNILVSAGCVLRYCVVIKCVSGFIKNTGKVLCLV